MISFLDHVSTRMAIVGAYFYVHIVSFDWLIVIGWSIGFSGDRRRGARHGRPAVQRGSQHDRPHLPALAAGEPSHAQDCPHPRHAGPTTTTTTYSESSINSIGSELITCHIELVTETK